MRIIVFGDSIAHGFWDREGGWVQRLRVQYDIKASENLDTSQPDVYNLSISGETAQGVLKRLPYEIKSRQHSNNLVIILAIGINDTMIYKGVEATPAEFFNGELQQLTESARKFTDKIIYVGLSAVDDTLCDPWQYSSTGKCFNNQRISEFNIVIQRFCKAEKIPFVNVHATFSKRLKQESLLADGLHPNEKGHQLIAELVRPELEKLISK